MVKSLEEEMSELEEHKKKLQQKAAHLQRQEALLNERMRKARTKMLIEIGGEMKKLGIGNTEQARRLREAIEASPQVKEWVAAILGQASTVENNTSSIENKTSTLPAMEEPAPTPAQVDALKRYGLAAEQIPKTKKEASTMIAKLKAQANQS